MEKAQSSNYQLSSRRSETHMGELVNDIQDLRNDLDKVLDQLKAQTLLSARTRQKIFEIDGCSNLDDVSPVRQKFSTR